MKKKISPIKIVKENNEKGKPTRVILSEDQIRRLIERLKNEIVQ